MLKSCFTESFDYQDRLWNQTLHSVHSQLNSRANLSPWPVAKYIGLLCFTTAWVFITWSFVPEDELQQWNMKVGDVSIAVVTSKADNKGHNVQLVMETVFLLLADWSQRESPCFTVWHRCSIGKHSLFPEGKNQVPLTFTVIQINVRQVLILVGHLGFSVIQITILATSGC